MGLDGDGMLSRLDLRRDDLDFAIPVFLIQGEQDLVTAPEVAEAWFNLISAPRKAFVRLPGDTRTDAEIIEFLKSRTRRIAEEVPEGAVMNA